MFLSNIDPVCNMLANYCSPYTMGLFIDSTHLTKITANIASPSLLFDDGICKISSRVYLLWESNLKIQRYVKEYQRLHRCGRNIWVISELIILVQLDRWTIFTKFSLSRNDLVDTKTEDERTSSAIGCNRRFKNRSKYSVRRTSVNNKTFACYHYDLPTKRFFAILRFRHIPRSINTPTCNIIHNCSNTKNTRLSRYKNYILQDFYHC